MQWCLSILTRCQGQVAKIGHQLALPIQSPTWSPGAFKPSSSNQQLCITFSTISALKYKSSFKPGSVSCARHPTSFGDFRRHSANYVMLTLFSERALCRVAGGRSPPLPPSLPWSVAWRGHSGAKYGTVISVVVRYCDMEGFR